MTFPSTLESYAAGAIVGIEQAYGWPGRRQEDFLGGAEGGVRSSEVTGFQEAESPLPLLRTTGCSFARGSQNWNPERLTPNPEPRAAKR